MKGQTGKCRMRLDVRGRYVPNPKASENVRRLRLLTLSEYSPCARVFARGWALKRPRIAPNYITREPLSVDIDQYIDPSGQKPACLILGCGCREQSPVVQNGAVESGAFAPTSDAFSTDSGL